ncbi:amino acid ABC transporter permease [Rhizobium giardinii]|uniref:His/Glu/Gln/Arg/opine family amino acid ABC transporter permease subunit n=1 Tax=Rhizobium giardinii TaxID=56731 RepID=A0A7W8XBM4_9HYPH|nr:amino acid ABC transporter permease [Rhizobium giardinii]MBB5538866.1 His/Glu/Gln/Arg/opine family amino acid ABC transporter permease subunit [Rhizobium giardinii]
MFDLLFHSELWLAVARGIPITIALTTLAMVFGLALGTGVAVLSNSDNPVLSWSGVAFTFSFRAIPLLTLLYFLYYALPTVGVIRHGPLWDVFFRYSFAIAVLGFSLNNAAYLAEVLRGGIKSVTPGQVEACMAVGMSEGMALRRVVLPIAFRNSVMTIGNELVFTLKATSLASAIAVSDVLSNARSYGKIFSDNISPYIAAAVFYLLMVGLIDLALAAIRKRTAM